MSEKISKPSDEKPKTIITLPVVPLREMIVFPGMMIPFVVGRKASIYAVETALSKGNKIFLVTQKEAETQEPTSKEIYGVGTVAPVIQSVKLSSGNMKVLVEGECRGRILRFLDRSSHLEAEVLIPDAPLQAEEQGTEETVDELHFLFKKYARLNTSIPLDNLLSSFQGKDLDVLTDAMASHLPLATADKQQVLETFDVPERAALLKKLLQREIERVEMDEKINDTVRSQMERAQREYYLNEKMKAIKKELGRKGEDLTEIEELRQKIRSIGMPKDVQEKAFKEIERLEAMPPVSAEATVTRGYLDWLIDMPWKKRSREIRDVKRAEEILNSDHYGLEEVKERILEHLAVRQLVDKVKASILCFVGPPGVGKTSLAKSIAEATGREFVRISLGGVRDEADIRGHRRTYIGAFPGQIIQQIKKAGTKNPVFLLDEIDKVGASYRGDPASALVEVLDPEQNHTFTDHYMDVEFDLSEVMFLTTANVLHTVPPALKDRLETIELSGYTHNEKTHIALDHLVPKQIKQHGLDAEKIRFGRPAIEDLIEKYTRESGVRNLERAIARVCRKAARQVVIKGKDYTLAVASENLPEFMGPAKYTVQRLDKKSEIGVAHGLAWTSSGGDVLTVEVSLLKGRGHLRLTGKLGEIMRESAKAALSYIRKVMDRLGQTAAAKNFYQTSDIHVHVPQGAIPKDGPSAGITIAAALFSAASGIPVRSDIAMTGEITLRGKVLAIGGVKEKVLAAHRFGVRHVILPKENQKDEEEIPEEVLKDMTLSYVEHMNEVLDRVLEERLAASEEAAPSSLTQ